MKEFIKGLVRKLIDTHTNAYHYKSHGTHQEHLDETDRILKERRQQPGYRDPDEDHSWIKAILIGVGGAATLGLFIGIIL